MRISCIIPVYNAARYLTDTLESVVTQDWPLHEIVVVDDGSNDGSKGVLDRYRKHIRLVEQPHSGIAAARNRGLHEATGDVIAFQDADDLWPAGRLRSLATALQAEPSVDIMAGLVEILDERPMKPPYRENLETTHRLFSVPSMLIRRSAFVRVGFFNQDLTVVEDTEFMMRCRRMSISVKKVHVVSLIYRLHENNLSRDVDRNFSNTVDALRVVSRMRRQS